MAFGAAFAGRNLAGVGASLADAALLVAAVFCGALAWWADHLHGCGVAAPPLHRPRPDVAEPRFGRGDPGLRGGGPDLAVAAAVAADRQRARALVLYTGPMLPVLLDPAKFKDALVTAKGEQRAHVALRTLETLWFNTGTLCNLTCQQLLHRILAAQRSPGLSHGRRGRRLSRRDRARRPRHQADRLHRRRAVHEPRPAGHAGGRAVARLQGDGADQRHEADAQDEARPARPAGTTWPQPHDPRLARPLRAGPCTRRSAARGAGSRPSTAWSGSRQTGFDVHVAGRRFSEETEAEVRAGYARLFAGLGITIDAARPGALVLFPEMDATRRRAGDHDGLLGHPQEVARQRDVRLGAHGGEAQGRRSARPSSPARCCPTTRSSSSATRWPKASAPCASTIRTAPSSACWAARPAASDDGHRRRHPDPERRPIPRADPRLARRRPWRAPVGHGVRRRLARRHDGHRAAGRRHRPGDRTRSRPAACATAPWPAARRGCCSCTPTRPCRQAGPPPCANSWRMPDAKGRLLPAALRVGRSARTTPGAPRRLALPHLRPALRRPGAADRARLLSPHAAAFAPCL